jgi:hypothetical protein
MNNQSYLAIEANNPDRVDAGARALRDHEMSGRITRDWDKLPDYDKKKWRIKSALVLIAALGEKQ